MIRAAPALDQISASKSGYSRLSQKARVAQPELAGRRTRPDGLFRTGAFLKGAAMWPLHSSKRSAVMSMDVPEYVRRDRWDLTHDSSLYFALFVETSEFKDPANAPNRAADDQAASLAQ